MGYGVVGIDLYLRHGKHQGGSDEWQTPLRLYLNLNKEFGFAAAVSIPLNRTIHF